MLRLQFALVLISSSLATSCLSGSDVPSIHGRDIRNRQAWTEVLANVVFLDYSSACSTDDGIFFSRTTASRDSGSCEVKVTNVGGFQVTLGSYAWSNSSFDFIDTYVYSTAPKDFFKKDPIDGHSTNLTFPVTLKPGDSIYCWLVASGNRGTVQPIDAQTGALALNGTSGETYLSIPLLTNAVSP